MGAYKIYGRETGHSAGGGGILPAQKTRCSEEELQRIVTLYGDQVLRFCTAYLGDRQLAEDAAQETFLAVYENYGTFSGKSSELTWITRIAINKCKNIRRKRYFNFETLHEGLLPPIHTPEETSYPSLLDEIAKLPPKEREAILLYYYQELNIREIAACCKAKETTVCQRLKRGRDKLKIALERMGFVE